MLLKKKKHERNKSLQFFTALRRIIGLNMNNLEQKYQSIDKKYDFNNSSVDCLRELMQQSIDIFFFFLTVESKNANLQEE